LPLLAFFLHRFRQLNHCDRQFDRQQRCLHNGEDAGKQDARAGIIAVGAVRHLDVQADALAGGQLDRACGDDDPAISLSGDGTFDTTHRANSRGPCRREELAFRDPVLAQLHPDGLALPCRSR